MDISKAMYEAMEKYPYYARGFAAMTPIKKVILTHGGKGTPTLGVDKYWRIYWSEEALESFKFNVAEVMCHELEHLLRDHADRCKDRHPYGWNLSADAEINDDIEGMPPDCVFPSMFEMPEGLTAEEYYQKGSEIARKNGPGKGGIPFCEGSGVTGQTEEWEEDAPKDNEAIPDQGTAEELRDQIANDIQAHAASGRGTVPQSVLLWAEARAKGRLPRISWRRAIRNQLRKIAHGRQDYSYGRMSRRQERGHRIILPGTIKYEPKLAVIIDTSGSMSNEADWVAGMLRDLAKMKAASVIIDCDADIHGVRPLKGWKDVLKSRGGGGTDMRVGVERAKREHADMIVVLTDGETPWPNPWPRNLVALVRKHDSSTEVRYG